MPATCVVGLQWGDEAKGKIVDLLTADHDMVVRYQGGANAGHTVVFGGEKYKLSLVPSGIFHPNVMCVVTGGVVLNPPSLLSEIDHLAARGIDVAGKLMLSDRAHVIFPWHMEEDRALDSCTGGESIGTTMRGIGPCYRDKVGRSLAVRLGDLYRPELRTRIEQIVEVKRRMLGCMGNGPSELTLDAAEIFAEYSEYARRLKPFVADTTSYLLNAAESGRRMLFEGAQGSLLDVDHGTFPYVTSSNSSGVGVSSGSGVPGRYLTKVIGVMKAYTTRVGGGPFPTEQNNDIGQHIRDRGNEYGTVTRRPRRCGWFDGVATRYSARLSGADCLAVMLLDVLGELTEINICTAYEIDGRRTTDFPSHVDDLRRAVPVYETLPGWRQEISDVRRMADLPKAARAYLDRLSRLMGRPVAIVSVGPDREQTVLAEGGVAVSSSPGTQVAAPPEDLAGLKLPRHIAIIMDGNGRWAQRRGLPRIEGHRRGAGSVRRTVEACARLGIEQLTLYCLSSENWKRPPEELDFLMELLRQYMIDERASVMENNLRLAVIGRREGLPAEVLHEMDETIALASANTGLRVCLAINYGGRAELADAVRRIAGETLDGTLRPDEITEETLQSHLYTAGMPELDLLVRTAGEMRVSNFLLWQMSYAELWVTERLWPDFDENELYEALRSFGARRRRFGGLESSEI